MSYIKIESFVTPLFLEYKNEWLDKLNIYSDYYIKVAQENNNRIIAEKSIKFNKNLINFGLVNHSESLLPDKKFEEFNNYILNKGYYILQDMGYDLNNYNLFTTELWVQEFPIQGGGYHEGHIHSNCHLSGFYFLKCSEKTSFPIFHDPRVVKIMSQLPLKNENEINFANNKINLKPNPGTLVFFPSYLEHEFSIDYGIETFRFIHFNIQAVPKQLINSDIKRI
jgi:uncharacterized protein (TIGR02466 family)